MAAAQDRLISLDVIRGIAVMGIFSVNIVGMAMIDNAYEYPPAFGFEAWTDKLMWAVNFVLIDGKMRSLFSMLFGASMLLVIERAVRAGQSPAKVHYARMIVLLALGFLHFLLLWWGDILTHYAAVGMVVFLLWKLRARYLIAISLIGFALYATPGVYFMHQQLAEYRASQAPDAPAELKKKWAERMSHLKPGAKEIAEDRAEHQSIATRVDAVVPDDLDRPFDLGPLWIETVSLMLLGMGLYKTGFITGEWEDRRYRKVAIACLGIAGTAFAAFAAYILANDFAPAAYFPPSEAYSAPLRPLMATGYAALIILLFRQSSAVRDRIAAVGRTAFSNYLGCTILGTFLFYGFAGNLYGQLSRGEAWLVVPLVWLAMLAWSKPWLDRFAYGPFEWLWRSLARWEMQPMRKRRPSSTAFAEA